MSVSEKFFLLWWGFLFLTLYCSYIGDDDVVYSYMGRKPTPKEGICRIRFVLAKTFACIYGGGGLAIFLGLHILKHGLNIGITKSQSIWLMLICMIPTNLFIGVAQNWVRRFQGRMLRPPFDIVVWRYNYHQWRNR